MKRTREDEIDISIINKKNTNEFWEIIPENLKKEIVEKFIVPEKYKEEIKFNLIKNILDEKNRNINNTIFYLPVDIINYIFNNNNINDYNSLRLTCKKYNDSLPDYYDIYLENIKNGKGFDFVPELKPFINRLLYRLKKKTNFMFYVQPRRAFDEKTRYIIIMRQDINQVSFKIDKDTGLIISNKDNKVKPRGYITIKEPESLFKDGYIMSVRELIKLGIGTKEYFYKIKGEFNKNTQKQKETKSFEKKRTRSLNWNESDIRRKVYNKDNK